MPKSILAPFKTFSNEGEIIGRLLAGYSNIELGLFHAVHIVTGDFDRALRKMFGIRGESKRIEAAEKLGLPEYQRLKLSTDFEKALRATRHCLKIRNQYAHWIWWDDYSGKLAFANVEDLTKHKHKVHDLRALYPHHVDTALLTAQEAYFVYADYLLAWVNHEAQVLEGKPGFAKQNPLSKPQEVKPPKLCL
jgi:hypothetical protein